MFSPQCRSSCNYKVQSNLRSSSPINRTTKKKGLFFDQSILITQSKSDKVQLIDEEAFSTESKGLTTLIHMVTSSLRFGA